MTYTYFEIGSNFKMFTIPNYALKTLKTNYIRPSFYTVLFLHDLILYSFFFSFFLHVLFTHLFLHLTRYILRIFSLFQETHANYIRRKYVSRYFC